MSRDTARHSDRGTDPAIGRVCLSELSTAALVCGALAISAVLWAAVWMVL